MAVTVSIGRNVGKDDQLDEQDWQDYADGLLAVFGSTLAVFEGFGTGYWTDDDGLEVVEQSYTVVFDTDVISPRERERLQDLARTFRQQSIAVTVGETEFIGPA